MNPKRGISKSQKSDGFGTNPTFAWDFFGTFGVSLLEEGGIQRQDFFKKWSQFGSLEMQMHLNSNVDVDAADVDGLWMEMWMEMWMEWVGVELNCYLVSTNWTKSTETSNLGCEE